MRPPRLHTILLVVSLVVLALPLGGIVFLKLYESALVRQTESELIGQGAFVAAAYKAALLRAGKSQRAAVARYGNELPSEAPALMKDKEERWRPRPAKLDLATDSVLPPPAEAVPGEPADPLAVAAGREIAALMREVQTTTLAAIRVVDYRGTIVASTGGELTMSLINRDEVQRALAGEYVSLLRMRISDEPKPSLTSISRGTDVRVFVTVPVVEGKRVIGAVALARSPVGIAQTLYRQRGPILLGIFFVLGSAAVVALLTAVTIARPLRAVIDQTKRAVRGEKGAVTPLARPGTHEVAQLSDAVAQLARTLESRADYIRDFAAHVSHEFKTPLTAIHGAVELLREHGATMTEAERRRFLDNLNADTVRLDLLVRRLLELARADTIQPGSEATPLAPILDHVAERYRVQGLQLTLDNRTGDIAVAMSGETLESILGTLLDNARQHGGTHVKVALTAERSAGNDVLLIISDDGPGISVANAGKIFQPFFTTARAAGGTGLGLAVVKSLLVAHGAAIRLVSSERGVIFEITLRVAARAPRGLPH